MENVAGHTSEELSAQGTWENTMDGKFTAACFLAGLSVSSCVCVFLQLDAVESMALNSWASCLLLAA